jgi:hypothetical protein
MRARLRRWRAELILLWGFAGEICELAEQRRQERRR